VQVDGHYRKFYFYHHRNRDGLIYREEQIGRKTFEIYKGRDDKLIYRSVTFKTEGNKNNKDLVLVDNHYKKECTIQKMTQKFELDPYLPAESQIRKTEFNLAKGRVFLFYHFREGKVTAKEEEFFRDDLIGQAKMGDMNEKDTEDSKLQ